MKYKATIEKADSFNAVLMTQNGYPVYDIMVPSNPGYCRASGLAFYTEDEKTLKEFSDLDTEKRKEYAINHPDSIKYVTDIFKNSKEMTHPMPLAYNHLIFDFEGTIMKGYYGCTHLVEGDKLLIFHQNKVFSKTGYRLDNRKEFNDLYEEIQNLTIKAYKEGIITPDGEIQGKALERLKSRNPEIFKEMTKYQAKILDVLKSFKNELLEDCKLTYEKEDWLKVNIQINNKNYVVNIPKTNKENLKLTMNENIQEFKDAHELIVEVYKDFSNQKLNSFMKKIKI